MPTPINWPPAIFGSGTGTQYTSPNGDVWVWTGYSWEGLIATATASAGTVYTKELISGGAVWNNGMTFDITSLTYSFYGPIQTTGATQVTLSNGDVLYDRIDAVVVNDDDPNGIVSVLEGIADPNPTTPAIDSSYLLVQYIFVGAGTTSLAVTQESIYDENVEWTGSVVGNVLGTGTFNFTSTSPTPPGGTLSLSVTGNNQYRWVRWTRSNDLTLTPYSTLSFYVYFGNAIPISRTLTAQFRWNGSNVGSPVNLVPPFGSRTFTGAWQLVVIPLSLFSISTDIDEIDFKFSAGTVGNQVNWSIDKIQLQSGFSPALTNVGPAYKPWGIYQQGSGTINFYNTFNSAIASSQAGDVIQLFGSVSETIASPLILSGKSLNLNGHTWNIYGATGSTALLAGMRVSKSATIQGGIINFLEYPGATGWLGSTSGAIAFEGGEGWILDTYVNNQTSTGSALKTTNGRRHNLRCTGSRFISKSYHGIYVDQPSSTSFFFDLVGVSTALNGHGIYSDRGGVAYWSNIIGYASYGDVSTGCGFRSEGGNGYITELQGYSSAEGGVGVYIFSESSWEIKDVLGHCTSTVGYGGYLEVDRSENTKYLGPEYGVLLRGGEHTSIQSHGKNYGMVIYRDSYTRVDNSQISGTFSVDLETESTLTATNSQFIGRIIGQTGSNILMTHSYVETSANNSIELGPLGSTAAETTEFTFNKIVSNGIGATYGIDVTGATARNFAIAQCVFVGPTASWNIGTITNTVIPSIIDSQGNIKY
jgi:hypothetical protein